MYVERRVCYLQGPFCDLLTCILHTFNSVPERNLDSSQKEHPAVHVKKLNSVRTLAYHSTSLESKKFTSFPQLPLTT
jgi:hypothetical protein